MLYIWDWHYCVLVSFNQSAYCSLIGGLTNQKFYYQLIGLVHTFTDLNTSINFVLRIKCKTGGKKKSTKARIIRTFNPFDTFKRKWNFSSFHTADRFWKRNTQHCFSDTSEEKYSSFKILNKQLKSWSNHTYEVSQIKH